MRRRRCVAEGLSQRCVSEEKRIENAYQSVFEALHHTFGASRDSSGAHGVSVPARYRCDGSNLLGAISLILLEMEAFGRPRRALASALLLFLVAKTVSSKILPAGEKVAQSQKERPVPLNFSIPNYDLYHRSETLQQELKALVNRHPQIMSIETLQAEGLAESGDDSYSAEMTVVTVQAGGTDFKEEQNLRLLFDFGQHGRELVTSEVALRLLQILGGEHPLESVDNHSLFRVLPHTTIKIIPIENLNGRKRVEAGDFCERKNGRGVDPNRNWGVDWGKKEKDYDPSEEYPGIAAFSEPETKMLRELAQKFKPHVWVNVHSGMEALFMPYDHKNTVPLDGARQMTSLLQTLNKRHCEDACVVGSGGGSVGYLAHGTATDYMYDKLRVPMAFTWEIYGDLSQPESDCFQMFNPVTPSKLESVLSKWSSTFLTLIVNLPGALQGLPDRFKKLEVWDWESRLASFNPDIPDFDLRSRFPSSKDAFRYFGEPQSMFSVSAQELDAIGITVIEHRLLVEFIFLLTGAVLCLICVKLFRCYLVSWDYQWKPLTHRVKRVPV